VWRTIHGEILEKVTTYSSNSSYRSFFFDTTDLIDFLTKNADCEIDLSVAAARLSDEISFRNPSNKALGLDVFHPKRMNFIYPNEPVLVDFILYREPESHVFTLKKA
jgi:hypothetical protein